MSERPSGDAGATGGPDDHALAWAVARAAGALLRDMRPGCFGPFGGEEADLAAHRFIAGELARHRPGDALLSEEGHDDRRRLDAARVWIVDPLDGTNEYTIPGRPDWAVHVCLTVAGEPVAGAVAVPDLGECHGTGPHAAAGPRPRSSGAPVRVALSRTRAVSPAVRVARALDAELVRIGSAGAKAAAVVRGDADAYVHAGGLHEWDAAAPAAVAAAAGLHVSRLDGAPLRFNQPRPYVGDLLICRPELAERIVALVTGAGP